MKVAVALLLLFAATICVVVVDGSTIIESFESESKKDDLHHYTCQKGDRNAASKVLCHQADSKSWNLPSEVKVALKCPAHGVANETISYIHVDIWMTSTNLNCDIIKGGIGEKSMEMLIEGLQTKKFKYDANVYTH